MQEIKFLYKEQNPLQMIFGVFILAGFTALLFRIAMYNEKGLSYKHIVTLSKDNATMVYWGLSVFMVATTLYFTFMMFKAITREKIQRYIVLNDSAISLPKNSSTNEIATISYSDIKNIKLHAIKKKCISLNIYYSGGQIGVGKSMVSESDFNQICTILSHMIKTIRRA